MKLRTVALLSMLLFFCSPAYPAFRIHLAGAARTIPGTSVPEDDSPEQAKKKTKKRTRKREMGFAIASAGCAILAIYSYALLLGAAAIILGFVGLSHNRKLKALSAFGVLLGCIEFVGWLLSSKRPAR